MKYITTREAAKRFNKSISTIKRVVAVAPDNVLQYEPSRTAKNRRLFISTEYLESKFSDVRNTTTSHHQDTSVTILQKEVERQEAIINNLLDRQKELIESNSNIQLELIEKQADQIEKFQILLDRSNQRANLLEQHFNKNKGNKSDLVQEEEFIEDIIEAKEEFIEDSKYVPNDMSEFTKWVNSMQND